MNENDVMTIEGLDFDFEETEKMLEEEIEKNLADLEILKEDKDKIANPDALGSVVLKEVWNQFGNQIGLDITSETLIQQYEREHLEDYKEVGKIVLKDERYKNAAKEMKEKQAEGVLKDEYTGKTLKRNDNVNLDHTVSRKEIYEDPRRKQANIATEDLANKKENLNPTNEALNKSKQDKSVEEYLNTRETREAELKAQNERANKKIDNSDKSDTEKRLEKEANNKRLQDKLDADDELMKAKDKQAREAINKDVTKGVIKETGKKAGKDALKAMAVQALFELLREVMNALIRFFKQAAKTFRNLLDEMKKAITSFFKKIVSFVTTGVTTAVGTIVSEVFGPVVSLFKKLSSFITQGFRSLGEAIAYLKNKDNKNKSFSVKVAEIGKIVVAGLTAMGAIFGSEIIEKALIGVFPALGAIQIPLLGSLANIIGLFISSMIFGIIGAIVLNFIDKAIANQQRSDNVYAQVEKGNDILEKQNELIKIKQEKLYRTEIQAFETIRDNHITAEKMIRESLEDMQKDDEKADITKAEIKKLLESLNED